MASKSIQTVNSTPKITLSPHVHARFIKESDKYAELAIIVDDETTAQELRDAWPKIDALREQLRREQGSDTNKVLTALRLSMAAKYFFAGATYAEIAMEANYDCMVNLCGAVILLDGPEPRAAREVMINAQLMLRCFRMKDTEIAEWTWSAIASIRDGYAPWTLERGPIDATRVRDALRQLEKELESQKIVIRRSPRTTVLAGEELQEVARVNKDPKEMADRLLNKEPEAGGLHVLKAAIQRQNAMSREKPG